jgi:hypothetical protein
MHLVGGGERLACALAAAVVLGASCGGLGNDRRPAGRGDAASSAPAADVAEDGGTTILTQGGVSLQVPEGWDGRVLFLDPAGDRALLQVANFELPEQHGFAPPPDLPNGAEDPIKAMTGDDVLLTILLGRGERAPGRLVIEAADFLPSGAPRVPRGHALATRSFCLEGDCIEVDVDFAEAPADASLLAQVNAVLATLTIVARDAAAPEVWTTYSDPERRFSIRYPASWRRAEAPLLSSLGDPKEIVTLSTFPAQPGGENCAHLPENALEAMGAADALLVALERHGGPELGGGTLTDYPKRPERFGLGHGYPSEARDCLDAPKHFVDRLIPFRDDGRRFYGYVAWGEAASDETIGEVFRILDSFEPIR